MITFTCEPKKVLSHQTESNKNGQFFSISFCNDHRSNFPYIKCLVIYILFRRYKWPNGNSNSTLTSEQI